MHEGGRSGGADGGRPPASVDNTRSRTHGSLAAPRAFEISMAPTHNLLGPSGGAHRRALDPCRQAKRVGIRGLGRVRTRSAIRTAEQGAHGEEVIGRPTLVRRVRIR